MNKAWTGALLSGLVLPGLGQMVQKRRLLGLSLMSGATTGIVVIVWIALQKALLILGEVQSGDGLADIDEIIALSEKLTAPGDNAMMHVGLWLFLFCWVYGMVDAWFAGRRQDRTETNNG